MKILAVDRTSEGQAQIARRVEGIDRVDRDILDIQVHLSGEENCLVRCCGIDVVILGSGLGDSARNLARKIKTASPTSEIIMFVSEQAYLSGAFRVALSTGVRKVLSDRASLLDLVQELMSINEEFRSRGRVRSGKVIAVAQAKGGVGVTSICAALGEVCSSYGQKTLLWDLDIETRDLCRALTADGSNAGMINEWIEGKRELSRESLREAIIPVSDTVSILPPPDHVGSALRLVGQVEAIELAQSIANLARATHESVIVDLAGRIGPGAGAILRTADVVVIVIDDSVLGLTAAKFFLSCLRSLVKNLDSICFLCSGINIAKPEIMQVIEREHRFGARAWRLPAVPFDPAAARWPGSGKTLYSAGKKATRHVFEHICSELGLIELAEPEPIRLLPYLSGRSRNDLGARAAAVNHAANHAVNHDAVQAASSPFRALWQRVANSF